MARIHYLSRSLNPGISEDSIAERGGPEILNPFRLPSERVVEKRLGEGPVLA
jgi:hypothetical protein